MSIFAAQESTTDKSQLSSNSPNTGLLSQRKYAFGVSKSSLTSEYEGNTRLQAKLTVGASKDPLEQEADQVADQVLAAPIHSAVSGAAPSIQRFTGQSPGDAGTAPASVDRVLSGSGRPLDPTIQQDMGQRFGHDFSQVKVHTGSAAEQSAQDVNARAYTVGHNIIFGAGGFAPGTHEGRKLIAHELTHVVQQSACTSSPVAIQRDADKDLTDDRVRDLKEYVASHPSPYKHVIDVIRFSKGQDLDDNVSADFVESLSSAQLEHFASTPEGREMLDVLYNAMMSGRVSSHETLQADRIVYAKWKFRPAEVYKVSQLTDPDAAPNPIVLIARKRGDELNHLAASKRYRDVIAGVKEDSSIEDDIAARFLTLQHPDRLEAYAATDEGRVMLGVLYDALITGEVTEFERLQADRILAAKAKTVRAPAAADIAKAVREPAIFPLATSWDSTATIRAELLPNAKVKVYYDSRTGLGGKEFARERASLYDRYGESIYSGIILEADEPVIVKLFDQGGAIVTVQAIKLIDFFNQQKEDTLGKIKTVSAMGATVGLGAIGAGGILGWAETIAFAINAGTLFIKANRDVIAKTAFGRRFLEAWDVAEGMVEYYNWGRLGVDGLKLVHATVSAPFKQWRQEVAAGLTSAERNTIAKAQQQTDEWLDAVKKAEAAEAAKVAKVAKAAKPAAADSQANAAPRGSQSATGYSRTPPTSEEDIAAAAGKSRRRPGIDRGKDARPRYAKDPVKPKVKPAPRPTAKFSEQISAPRELEANFPAPDWEHQPVFLQGKRVPRVKGKNPLLSTEPDWYSKSLDTAVEVKNKDFVGRLESVDWKAIDMQLVQRMHSLPAGTKNWIIFDIRKLPLGTVEQIGAKLSSKWDAVFFMTDNGLSQWVPKR